MGTYPQNSSDALKRGYQGRFYLSHLDTACWVIFTRVSFNFLSYRRHKRMVIAMFFAAIHGFSIHRQNKSGYASARKYAAFFRFRGGCISAAFGCRTVRSHVPDDLLRNPECQENKIL